MYVFGCFEIPDPYGAIGAGAGAGEQREVTSPAAGDDVADRPMTEPY
jgi:hypothetical protein